MIDFALRQQQQMLQFQQSIDRKKSGNALTYQAYTGLRGSFSYMDGTPVEIFPVVDQEGNIIAITWNGLLRGPIQGQFIHYGVPLGTQLANVQINGEWVAFLLNFIPSECLPEEQIEPSIIPFVPLGPTLPDVPATTPPEAIVRPSPVGPSFPPEIPVPEDSVIICIQGFWVAKTGINYLPSDRVLLNGFEEEFMKRQTELIPRIDGDGRVVSVSIEGDTCNLPYLPTPYIPSPTGNNVKLIPIPKLIPISNVTEPLPDEPYINPDGRIIKPPIKTVYCYNH